MSFINNPPLEVSLPPPPSPPCTKGHCHRVQLYLSVLSSTWSHFVNKSTFPLLSSIILSRLISLIFPVSPSSSTLQCASAYISKLRGHPQTLLLGVDLHKVSDFQNFEDVHRIGIEPRPAFEVSCPPAARQHRPGEICLDRRPTRSAQ